MAVTLNTNAGFFEKVLGVMHPTTKHIKSLISAGAVFEVGLYTVKVTIGGQVYQKDLTVGATALMKGTVNPDVLQVNRLNIINFVKQLPSLGVLTTPTIPIPEPEVKVKSVSVVMKGATSSVNLLVLIKTIRTLTGLSLKDAKMMAEEIISGANHVVALSYVEPYIGKVALSKLVNVGAIGTLVESPHPPLNKMSEHIKQTETTVFPVVKPIDSVISLRDAKAIGQKVKGTSSGSVYHCVALNARMRLAARIYSGSSISIRAEWQGATADEMKKLKEVGMQVKDNYASIHLNAGNIPYGRVVGAFILGMNIKWDQVVLSSLDLAVDG